MCRAALSEDLVSNSTVLQETLAELNTLICLSGSYFGQGEEYDSRQHREYDHAETHAESGTAGPNLMSLPEDDEENVEGDSWDDEGYDIIRDDGGVCLKDFEASGGELEDGEVG